VAADDCSRTIRSMEGRELAVSLARARIAIGVVSLLVPRLVARTMTGRDGSEGGTGLFARMVGARDFGLGLGMLVALDRGAPVRGWHEASAVVDGIDAVACLLARRHIRTSALPGTVGLAASGALLSAWLARHNDSAQSPRSGQLRRSRPAGRSAPSPCAVAAALARRPCRSGAHYRPGTVGSPALRDAGQPLAGRMLTPL
jgi:hypothetical protein